MTVTNNNKQKQQHNKNSNNNKSDTSFIRYDGMNDTVNALVLETLQLMMHEVCYSHTHKHYQAWHSTFFPIDQFASSMYKTEAELPYFDYAGMEPILNFYKPFKTGELSWQVNEDEWNKKAQIDSRCRQQMKNYYLSIKDLILNVSQEEIELASKLFKQLLNQIYNKLTEGGGHTSPIWPSDFLKPESKANGCTSLKWTNSDIDWNAYEAKRSEMKLRNQIDAERFGNFYSYMKNNNLFN